MFYFLLFIIISLNGIAVNDMELGRRVQLTSEIVSIKQKDNTTPNGASVA
jgi:hypothetical protein